MQLRGLRLLRIAGIQIVLDYSWFVVFFLVVYTMSENYFPQTNQHYTAPQYWFMGVIAAMLLFASVLLHELAHSLVALRYGIKVTSIRLFIFGGLAQVSSEPKAGRHEFLIALAGPATSMVLGAVFGGMYMFSFWADEPTPAAAIAWYLAAANVILAVFNMIPGFPLDGGRILRAILWDRWGNMARATRVVTRLGNGFALFLIILGILQFVVAQSRISGLWLVLLGLFMKQSAVGSYQAVMLKQVLAGVQIRQVMREDVVKVDWLTSLEELVREYIYRHPFKNFPVFNREEFVGMVSLDGVKGTPKDLWAFKQVRDIMTPVELVPCLRPADDAMEALERMVSSNVGRMPVVEDGHLLGIVSRGDIMDLFKIKSDLGVA